MMCSPILALTVSLLLLTLVAGSRCPDDHGCRDEQTCCLVPSSGEFNCCPFHQGECCDDHVHCCPEGFMCQPEGSKCSNATHSIRWAERVPSKLPDQASEDLMKESGKPTKLPESRSLNVPCNDTAACPDGNTCCKTLTGDWGCCPLVEAVCCSDGAHCCPKGYTCAGSSCEMNDWRRAKPESLPFTKLLSSSPRQNDIQCGGGYSCKDAETCCQTSATAWGCCPSPNAVCCSDRKHCCPTGYMCDDEGSCSQAPAFNWEDWETFVYKKKQPPFL